MELTIAFVRAGACKSEWAGRLAGRTDEPLAPKSRQQILARMQEGVYPAVPLVFAGEAARCLETARLIWPAAPAIVEKELRPFDYGVFDGSDPRSLSEDERFLEWASVRTATAFPDGESPYALLARSTQAFSRIIAEMASKGIETAAIVSHHMVIQTILQRYCIPRSNFRNWETPFGGGYVTHYDTIRAALHVVRTI